jgi:hypothetical protein
MVSVGSGRVVVEDDFRVVSHPWSERDLSGGLEGTLAQIDLILDNRENPKRIRGAKPMWRWHLLTSLIGKAQRRRVRSARII